MKNNKVFPFILLAAICLVLGLIDKLAGVKLFVRGYTWHELAQTFLLFGIAWGIGQNFFREVKEK
jgi:hypothetical protein